MLSKLFDKVWDILDQPVVVTFGSECASVVSWTVLTCLLRALLMLLRVHPFLPNALLFANPILLEKFCHVSIFGCPVGITPNLPVRIAESLLGRTASVIVIIPAHLIGSIMGVAVVKLLLGLMCVTQASAQALIPIIYEYGNPGALIGWQMFFGEILVNFTFVLVYLIMPEALKVNKKPMWITWLFLLPLLLVRLPDQSKTPPQWYLPSTSSSSGASHWLKLLYWSIYVITYTTYLPDERHRSSPYAIDSLNTLPIQQQWATWVANWLWMM